MTLLLGFGGEAQPCYVVQMGYRQAVPYPARYLIALLAWAPIVAADLLLRACFLAFMPVLWLRSWQSQPDAQTAANTADFIYRPFMRFPRLDVHRLVSRRRSRGTAGRGPIALK